MKVTNSYSLHSKGGTLKMNKLVDIAIAVLEVLVNGKEVASRLNHSHN